MKLTNPAVLILKTYADYPFVYIYKPGFLYAHIFPGSIL